jgi:hypothetical protein
MGLVLPASLYKIGCMVRPPGLIACIDLRFITAVSHVKGWHSLDWAGFHDKKLPQKAQTVANFGFTTIY